MQMSSTMKYLHDLANAKITNVNISKSHQEYPLVDHNVTMKGAPEAKAINIKAKVANQMHKTSFMT